MVATTTNAVKLVCIVLRNTFIKTHLITEKVCHFLVVFEDE